MNIIAPQFIRDYFLEKFKDNYKMSSGETELIVPSVYTQNDYKRHMSINLDTGLWQCFKTETKATSSSYMLSLKGITYNQAEADILFKEFDGQIESITSSPTKPVSTLYEEHPIEKFGLRSIMLDDYESEDRLVQKAWTFLYERKLFNLETGESKYYVATQGRYTGRLFIPFEEIRKFFTFRLELWGAKHLNTLTLRITGLALHIYFILTTKRLNHLVICEGPLDAISLQIQGVNATCTMGCSVSDYQVEAL
jgi:hypothetical protein